MNRSGGVVAFFSTILLVSAAPLTTASATTSTDLQDLWFPATSYSHESQVITGQMELSTADTSDPSAGNDSGWGVTMQASALQYSGRHSGETVEATDLSVISVDAPVVTESLGVTPDSTAGPKLPDHSPAGSLDTPRLVLTAEPGYARGSYVQGVLLSLTLPPGARSGTYTGTITTTVSPTLNISAEPNTNPSSSTEPELAPETEPTAEVTAEPTPAPSPQPEPSPEPEPEPTVEPTPATVLEQSSEPEPTASTSPAP